MATRISPSVQSSAGAVTAPRVSWPRPKYLLFGFIGLMYAYVFWNNERFLFDSKHPAWSHFDPFKWWLLPHGLTAACALLLGPLQFSDRLRLRFAKLHRVMGRFYVAGVFIGAPLGFYIQYFEERLGASRNFTVAAAADAVLWMFSTAIAMLFIFQGKIQQHRQWMTRSFCSAIIFLEVRAIIGITGWTQYGEIIVWCCVAAAIPLADFILHGQDLRRTRTVPVRQNELPRAA